MSDKLCDALIDGLNGADRETRLSALLRLLAEAPARKVSPRDAYVNNHIHTIYSFSPYSPTKAAWEAWTSGLLAAGIMDHDSVAGAEEFQTAGRYLGVAATTGLEARFSFRSTPFRGKRLNNTDQLSIAYLTLHGIPARSLGVVENFIAPYRKKRVERGMRMTERLNELLSAADVSLDFSTDVAGVSQVANGGTITERHILYAAAKKLVDKIGAGSLLVERLRAPLGVNLPDNLARALENAADPHYLYRLLGALKSRFLPRFYVEAGEEETPDVSLFLDLAKRAGAIAAYPYLGDVKGSVTGDKRDDAFEDAYLDELIEWCARAGFNAVTYMPARNTAGQLDRLSGLCKKHNLFEISGEDINTPFQSFVCPAIAEPRHAHLIESTWALLGHEALSDIDGEYGMFSESAKKLSPDMSERVARFSLFGLVKRSPHYETPRI